MQYESGGITIALDSLVSWFVGANKHFYLNENDYFVQFLRKKIALAFKFVVPDIVLFNQKNSGLQK